ncbi:MAG: PspC domain-containing protein [Bacteroidia bacterium]|nr:PspC domain-containing protein [Bacteroidia bacterium]
MKKIININLSGRVIPIEDTAYEKLQGYIESLRRYFSNEEGRDEIINDIESRVAELMNEKIRKGATAVTDADIDEIIASMGRTEDFEAADFADETAGSRKNSQSESTYAEPKKKTRLYRSSNDKVIGGVCSGLANYLNVDPAIVRLLFAIITFGGFGFGVLAYILMWIILPEEKLETYGGRRLYRNPEDKIFGGVAGGLAAYFNKDAKIIRLIFAAPLLLNILIGILSIPFFSFGAVFPTIAFGSLTGTFVLVYIIMWIVLPEANTEYQKMEMRGEKVDVNRIRQNVQDKAKEFGNEVKAAAQSFGEKVKTYSKEKSKTFTKEVNEAGARVSSGLVMQSEYCSKSSSSLWPAALHSGYLLH